MTSNINTECCRGTNESNAGEWHFPNGTVVPRFVDDNFADFTRRGGTRKLRMERNNNATMPTGTYQCRVPDGENIVVANITLITGQHYLHELTCTGWSKVSTL